MNRGGLARFARRCLGVALVLGAAGMVAVTAGFAPVAASSGHWAITDWFLHFAMRRAVNLRSLTVGPPPPLDRESALLRGAGHYATGCAPCHGAPGEPPSEVVRHMTPPPPLLAPRIPEWAPEELFYIVRHGVKFTGMPAWPTQLREEEVWEMVSFLEALPALTPEGYRGLAYGDLADEPLPAGRLSQLSGFEARLADCARCHGRDGEGRGAGAFPRLTGQSRDYLAASLAAYAEGRRASGPMQAAAGGLDSPTIARLADHFAAARGLAAAAPTPGEPAELALGEEIARRGLPAQGVPSCVHCHGPGSAPRNPLYPHLAGQYPGYLAGQLRLFKEGRRGGTPYAHLMEAIASRMSQEQMEAVAGWYGAVRE